MRLALAIVLILALPAMAEAPDLRYMSVIVPQSFMGNVTKRRNLRKFCQRVYTRFKRDRGTPLITNVVTDIEGNVTTNITENWMYSITNKYNVVDKFSRDFTLTANTNATVWVGHIPFVEWDNGFPVAYYGPTPTKLLDRIQNAKTYIEANGGIVKKTIRAEWADFYSTNGIERKPGPE